MQEMGSNPEVRQLLKKHRLKKEQHDNLVGGIPTPLKNMKVNWDDYSQHIWENKKCSKILVNWDDDIPN